MAQASAQNAANPYASASLYVGDLKSDVTEATLFEVFNAVGPVASIRVCRDSVTRRSLGYAYVNFHSVQDAERALDTMNFTEIRAKQCRIMWSQRDPHLRKSGKGNIFVKNLHESIDNKTLYDTFSVFGDILSCKVVTEKGNGKSLGYGYVHYIDEKSSKKAIDGVNGMSISDKVVHAEYFRPKAQRKFTNVYVKYIPESVTEEALIKLFEDEVGGKITSSVYWKRAYGICACFNFEKPEHARLVVDKFLGRVLDEAKQEDSDGKSPERPKALYVARCEKQKERKRQQTRRRPRPNTRSAGVNLYIKNLADEVDDGKLQDMFKDFGDISSVKVMRDVNGKSRNFGFVCFKKKEEATRAMHQMHGRQEYGKSLCVFRAQKKEARRAFLNRKRNQYRNQMLGWNNYPRGGFNPAVNASFANYSQPFAAQMATNQMRAPQMQYNFNAQQIAAQQMAARQQWIAQQQQFQPAMANLQMRNNNIPPNFAAINQMARQPAAFVGPQSVPRGGVPFTSSQNAAVGTAPNVGPSGPNAASVGQGQSISQVSHHSASQQELLPLTAAMLQNAKPEERKRFIGERLFPKIQAVEPRRAGKITGMLLEMEDTELLVLLQDHNALLRKINEALAVLKDHQIKQSQGNPSQTNAQGSAQNNSSRPNQAYSQGNPQGSAAQQQTQ